MNIADKIKQRQRELNKLNVPFGTEFEHNPERDTYITKEELEELRKQNDFLEYDSPINGQSGVYFGSRIFVKEAEEL